MAMAPDQLEDPDAEDRRGPTVTVKYLNTNEKAHFKAAWNDTVAEVWARSYIELGEVRKDTDKFETDDGVDLTGRADSTLEELRKEHIAKDHKFAIRSETGGA
jgi:hypothetical protein